MDVMSRTAGPTRPDEDRCPSGHTLAHKVMPAARKVSCSITNTAVRAAAKPCIDGTCQLHTTTISAPQNASAAAGADIQPGHDRARAITGPANATASTCASMCEVNVFARSASIQLAARSTQVPATAKPRRLTRNSV